METKQTGYAQKQYSQPVKCYARTLDLKDDPDLITQYIKVHNQDRIWKEIPEGIRAVGILEMEIYMLGTKLFMIVTTPFDFDWDTSMAKLASLPRQAEWEEYTAIFQVTKEGKASTQKWQLMDRIFHLDG